MLVSGRLNRFKRAVALKLQSFISYYLAYRE